MKNTAATFAAAKAKGEKLSMLTAYDYSTAKLEDESVASVGDDEVNHLSNRIYNDSIELLQILLVIVEQVENILPTRNLYDTDIIIQMCGINTLDTIIEIKQQRLRC